MTVEKWNRRHGKTWDALRVSGFGQDLMMLCYTQSPSASAHRIPVGVQEVNGAVLFQNQAGWQLLVDLLFEKLGSEERPESDDEEATFEKTPEEQFAAENPVRTKRKPKKK